MKNFIHKTNRQNKWVKVHLVHKKLYPGTRSLRKDSLLEAMDSYFRTCHLPPVLGQTVQIGTGGQSMNLTTCKCNNPERSCTCPKNWAHCGSCHAEITWVKTKNGNNMPVNGHIRAKLFEHGTHTPHWSSCPHSEQYRKRQTKLQSAAEAAMQLERESKKAGAYVRREAPKIAHQMNLFAQSNLEELQALREKQMGGRK